MSVEVLKSGDWVRTNTGATGQVMFVNGPSAFVDVQYGTSSHTATYLLSELAKIDEPPCNGAND
jgi:hypothetical protein